MLLESWSRATILALKVSGGYLLLGLLWILFSDAALSSFIVDIRTYAQVQILKGWFFVLSTAVLLFFSLKALTASRERTLEELRRNETERMRADERFRAVVEASPTAMLMIDSRGTINLVNGQAERLFGYSRSELIGAHLEMLLPEGARAKHENLREGFVARGESRPMGGPNGLRGRRKDGSEFLVEVGLTQLETPKGKWC